MSGIAIILLIVIFFWLFWPMIARWLRRKAMERAEDYMRSSLGMPPRDKKRKNNASGRQQYQQQSRQNYGYGNGNAHHHSRNESHEPIIPKEYAEDVEFVEIKEFSSTTTTSHSHNGKTRTIYHESQISDVEFTEIKKSRS